MRLFAGIFPPPTVQRDVEATLRLAPRGPRLRWTAWEKLHVTLAFLGEVPPARVTEVRAAIDAAAAGVAPFSAEVHGLGGFPDLHRPRVLFLDLVEGGDACTRLARGLLEALPLDLRPDDARPLHPHLTLARPKRPPRPDEMQELDEELRAWRWRFAVDELRLVESVLDPAGARYTARHVTALVGRD